MLALPRWKACIVLTHYIIGAVACFTMVQNIFMWMGWLQMHKPSSCEMLPCLLMINHHNKDYCHLTAACSMFDTEPPRNTQNICNGRLVTHAQSCACVLQSQLSTHCVCKHNAKRLPGEIMAYQARWHLLGLQRKGLQPCRAGVVKPPLQSATAIGTASAPASSLGHTPRPGGGPCQRTWVTRPHQQAGCGCKDQRRIVSLALDVKAPAWVQCQACNEDSMSV